MNMIGIVTVLYNCAPVLEDFFRTLNQQTYKDFILYVVDNKSSDNSLSEAKRLAKTVDFQCVMMPQEENGGVARGNNIGIKAALADHCEYVLLSNNDIVLENDTIEKLLEGLIRNDATMAVPKTYYWNTDKIIWMAGGKFQWLKGMTHQIGIKEKDCGQYDKDALVTYAPTCFMLINSDVFHRVGMMDEKYFVYFDDTDFVWRANHVGERLYYIFESEMYHKVSFSTGGGASDFFVKYLNRNRVYFVLKQFSTFHCICVFAFLLFKLLVKDIWIQSFKRTSLLVGAYREGLVLYFSKIKRTRVSNLTLL